MGFAQSAIATSALHAELLAPLAGLEVAFTKNLFSIVIETDSQVLCNLFNSQQHQYSHLIADCCFFLDVVGLDAITHIYR